MNFSSTLRSKKPGFSLILIILIAILSFTSGCDGGSGDDPAGVAPPVVPDVGIVTGTVTDTAGGAALSGVTVSIGTQNAATDVAGLYTIIDVPVGSNTISAALTGYDAYSGSVTVTVNATTTHDFTMSVTPPPDTTNPTDPSGLTATAVSATQVDLSWTGSTDNVAVTGYRIYNQPGNVLLATTAATTYSAIGLGASTSYCFTVSAVDAAGNESGQTAQACDTTSAAPIDTSYVIFNLFGPSAMFTAPPSSIAAMMFHCEDGNSNILSLTEVPEADFSLLHNGGPPTSESSFVVLPRPATYTINTVVLINQSTSLSDTELADIKAGVNTWLAGGLLANQSVAIYSFDDRIELEQDFTTNTGTLTIAVNGIPQFPPRQPSTDLFGAGITGVGRWSDSYDFLAPSATFGYMVIISDFDDTAYLAELGDFTGARGKNWVFTIGAGAELDTDNLTAMAYPAGNSYNFTDFTQVATTLSSIQTYMDEYYSKLFFLEYTSAARDGDHTVTVFKTVNTNISEDDSSVEGNFNAAGFTSSLGWVEWLKEIGYEY
jgi:hypothetical protein